MSGSPAGWWCHGCSQTVEVEIIRGADLEGEPRCRVCHTVGFLERSGSPSPMRHLGSRPSSHGVPYGQRPPVARRLLRRVTRPLPSGTSGSNNNSCSVLSVDGDSVHVEPFGGSPTARPAHLPPTFRASAPFSQIFGPHLQMTGRPAHSMMPASRPVILQSRPNPYNHRVGLGSRYPSGMSFAIPNAPVPVPVPPAPPSPPAAPTGGHLAEVASLIGLVVSPNMGSPGVCEDPNTADQQPPRESTSRRANGDADNSAPRDGEAARPPDPTAMPSNPFVDIAQEVFGPLLQGLFGSLTGTPPTAEGDAPTAASPPGVRMSSALPTSGSVVHGPLVFSWAQTGPTPVGGGANNPHHPFSGPYELFERGNIFNGPGLEQILHFMMGNDPNNQGSPPTARGVLEVMLEETLTEDTAKEEVECAICQEKFAAGDEVHRLCDTAVLFLEENESCPCTHTYHKSCIIPWLEQHNSCPVCRFEFPTDDVNYERQKAALRRQIREAAAVRPSSPNTSPAGASPSPASQQ